MRVEVDIERDSPLHDRIKQYADDEGYRHDRAYRELLEEGLIQEGY